MQSRVTLCVTTCWSGAAPRCFDLRRLAAENQGNDAEDHVLIDPCKAERLDREASLFADLTLQPLGDPAYESAYQLRNAEKRLPEGPQA